MKNKIPAASPPQPSSVQEYMRELGLSVQYASDGSLSHGTRSVWSFDSLGHCLTSENHLV
jgi:hypothetical protein